MLFCLILNAVLAVIYDGCPKTITQGIWWPRTKFNLPAAVPCPKGSVGVYTQTSVQHHVLLLQEVICRAFWF